MGFRRMQKEQVKKSSKQKSVQKKNQEDPYRQSKTLKKYKKFDLDGYERPDLRA